MRIASGDTGREVAFVAVDATDFATRETGLSSFTVYRMRDGGTPTAMTTPTVTEVDSSNMPGVYTLLVDEDTTIGAGNDEEEMVFHITHAGMAPVTQTVNLFRPKFTEGSTLGLADINAECDTAISDASLATAANLATVDTNVDAILVDTGTTIPAQITALNNLSAADVNAEVDTALADYDAPTKAELDSGLAALNDPTAAAIADAVWTETLADHSGSAGSTAEGLSNASAPTAAAVADAVWDEAIADHLGAGSTGASLNAAGGSGDPWVTALPGSYTSGQAGRILADILDDTGTTLPATLATIDGNVDAILVDTGTTLPATLSTIEGKIDTVDTNVDAVLVDTDSTIPGLVAALNDLSLADVRTAVGLSSANLDTQLAALPTATENADALLNRDMSAVSDTNARTPLNALRFLRNNWSVSGTTLTVTKEDDSTSAWTATLTADASANPVVGSDPA